ncbi:MAG: DUF4476 domain-containing protein [Flavobacteriales bacterium]
MNGLRYNAEPATNIRITDLPTGGYKVKAILEDESVGQATTTITLDPALEKTFNIRAKKKTMLGTTLKKMVNQVARDLNISNRDTTTNPDIEIYVIRWVSDVNLSGYVQNNETQTGSQESRNQQIQQNNTQQTNQSTSVVNSTNTMTTSVDMQVNDPDGSVYINMSVSAPDLIITEQTTTVTITQTSTTIAQHDHYVMPGYSGPIGCPWPMKNNDFNAAKNSIKKSSFEDDKLNTAKQIVRVNCITTEQVKELIKLMSFEESKLDFAKFAYSRTYDLGNYFQVNEAFTFSSSEEQISEFIEAGSR